MREVVNVFLEFGTEGRSVYLSTLAHLFREMDK